MGRPRKARRIETVLEPVIYIPGGWTKGQPHPVEVAIEDFEIMRLVDGWGYTIVDAAEKVGVSRSTAGRMLERCRRAIAQGIEKRAPVYLDASKDLVLEASESGSACKVNLVPDSSQRLLAIACHGEATEDSPVARIFGRAPEFAIISEEAVLVRTLHNSGFGVSRNAAGKAVQLLASQNVGRIVAGRFGAEALRLLGEAKIQPMVASGLSIRQVIELFIAK